MPTGSWIGLAVSVAVFATIELIARRALGAYAHKQWTEAGVQRLAKTPEWWTKFTIRVSWVLYGVAVLLIVIGVVA